MRILSSLRHWLGDHSSACRASHDTDLVFESLEDRLLLTALPYHLTFDEEFNALQLWNGAAGWQTTDYQGNRIGSPPDGQDQYYADPTTQTYYNPFSVSSGVLNITADHTPAGMSAAGMPYVSGMISTAHGFSQQYGYFEMRAKLPAGKGLWSAFWMLPADGVANREYDIQEVLGNDPTSIYQTTHWDGTALGYNYQGQIDSSDGFHTYGFKWDANNVVWYIDGVATQTQPNVSDEPMYMLANLAVGGNWPGDPDASTPFPSTMQIDYIRVYSNDPDVPAVTPQSGYTGVPAFLTSSLPMGWSGVDVGMPAIKGSASFSGSTWTLNGSGAQIGLTSDQFHFANQTLNGDGTIVANVNSLTNTSEWAKAGIMFRHNANANSLFASVALTPSHGVTFQWRTSTGATAGSATIEGISGPVWVKLTRSGNSFAGFYSTDGSTWIQIDTNKTIAMNTKALVGLAVTSRNVGLTATATFSSVTISLGEFTADNDIGNPSVAGSAYFADDYYTVIGGGTGIATTTDGFNFLNKTWTGDGEIVARISDMTNTHEWAKAGVMFRHSTAANAMFAAVVATPTNGVRFIYRLTTGANATGTYASVPGPSSTAPLWLKLRRNGNAFSGFYSTDGVTWTQIGTTQSIAMASSAKVGLAVSGNNNSLVSAATFDHVATSIGEFSTKGDIGSPGVLGYTTFNGTSYNVSGGGNGIESTSDGFHFVRKSWSGDGSMIARITSLTHTDAWAKAGVMFRDSTAANAMFAAVLATPSNGVRFVTRTSTGGSATDSYISVPAPSASAPLWLKVNRSVNAFSGYYSTDGIAWTQIGGAVTVPMASTAQTGLAISSNVNTVVSTAAFSDVTLFPLLGLFAADNDIGNTGVAGSGSFDGTTYTVAGSGTGMATTSDGFNFLSGNWSGDGTLVARITSMTNTDPWARTGIMFRESSASNSRFAAVVATPGNGVRFITRTVTNGNATGSSITAAMPTPSSPLWVKLERVGDSFTGYYSTTGATWTQIGTAVTVPMEWTLSAGLAVSSSNNSLLNTSTFTDVSVS